jgi:hypothetical protein
LALKRTSLDQCEQALGILWFHDQKTPDVVMSAGQLGKIIHDSGLGVPNSTRLNRSLSKSGKVISSGPGYRLKALARAEIHGWLRRVWATAGAAVDQERGYLPKAVWQNTRGYLERVCVQINGCYEYQFYDATSVLVRRLIETLIIECYEHLKRADEIKGADGFYVMLRDLVARATGTSALSLSRNTHQLLKAVKELGDRSAHDRRYNAVRADLEKIQQVVRAAVDDMVNLASLRRAV